MRSVAMVRDHVPVQHMAERPCASRPQVGEVIGRFERKGFKLVGLKMHTPSRQLAEEHYADLSSKPFFKDLVNYIISGPVVCMVWLGPSG